MSRRAAKKKPATQELDFDGRRLEPAQYFRDRLSPETLRILTEQAQ